MTFPPDAHSFINGDQRMMNPAVQRSHNSPAAARAGLSLRTYLLIESNRATFKLSAYEYVTEMLSIALHHLLQEAAALSKAPAAGHRHRINESENNPVLEFLNLGREPSDEVKILPTCSLKWPWIFPCCPPLPCLFTHALHRVKT